MKGVWVMRPHIQRWRIEDQRGVIQPFLLKELGASIPFM